MNAKASAEAIRDRVAGQAPSRVRAVVMAGTAGAGVAVAVYKLLRDPE